jgi:hypothetical protein
MTGWTLTSADSISADGQYIAGSGWNPDGQRTAWIAHVPEPSGVAAFTCVAWLSTQRRRAGRRRRHPAPC